MNAYPPAPWHMHGSLWLSVFRLARDVDVHHPAGTYGVALVSYEEPSPLTYHELLLARTVKNRAGKGAVTITDIWVDSPASQAGGRALWAIPKELCDFDLDTSFRGPVTSTDWSASVERRPIVEASFTDVSRAAIRMPFTGLVEQPGIPEHPETADVVMKGNAKALPCRGRWSFAADGPLGFMREARQLGSFRMAGFRLAFD
ncbi:acetoacetate decarboxylase family protein [Nocardioides daeguensis]|uniref:Acetoacetate decarboxylase family protein n=1 Tax=Nocardioides daeguensis TaxID=908359 RepID=A0ABP6UX21_9ACTN|nr:acetoacetate decarboxylase family protein [Nocardioides daeguensis]MBV6725882.1 acetoacetate decarboxylase family protein [Nocardioides daeguensis]MCR1772603.1 acetoacetate decarboxylase family protein [Nocardioides daeguensis]